MCGVTVCGVGPLGVPHACRVARRLDLASPAPSDAPGSRPCVFVTKSSSAKTGVVSAELFARGELSPLLAVCGARVRFGSMSGRQGEYGDASLDNQFVTFLMADARTGFAPPHWQCGLGRCWMAREDGGPLTTGDYHLLACFANDAMDAFGDGKSPAFLTPRNLSEYVRGPTAAACGPLNYCLTL